MSFVVPVSNDAARLRLSLQAILKAVVASGEVEVIVADNGSTDDSKEMAEGAGNMVVRRSAFLKVGGFDESLTACGDVDLSNRLRRLGWTILNDSRLFNVHPGDPETLR